MLNKCPSAFGKAHLTALAACLGSVQLMLLIAGFCFGLSQQAGKRSVNQLRVGLAPGGQFLFQRVPLLTELFEALGFVLRLLGELCLFALGDMTALNGLVAFLTGALLASFQPLLPGVCRGMFAEQ